MSVYVDPIMDWGWKLGPSCHMTADSDKELHAMAKKIGMKQSWFQAPPEHIPGHYDLVASKRRLAVQHGAVELSFHDAGLRYMQATQEHHRSKTDVR